MKQLQFEYRDPITFRREMKKAAQWCRSIMHSAIVFDIFAQTMTYSEADEVRDIILSEIPEALYRGCSTNGNIFEGRLADTPISVSCTIYEYPDTKVEIMQVYMTSETEKDVVDKLAAFVKDNPWVKAIEMLITIRGMSMTSLCEDMSLIDPSVKIFGGGAFAPEFNENHAYVFSSSGECSDNAAVFMMLGGDDLHVHTTYITGWKPLGKELIVTRAEGSTIYELDHRPAYETYYKYLHIKNDENFFTNTLEFPFFYEHEGMSILRAPIASNPDGSLSMTADVEQNVKARIAYGDPWTILYEIQKGGQKLAALQPEVIHIYSCAARRTFWGSEIGKETMPFQSIAPTSGFYTSGEFLRTDGVVNQHNVTLVVAAYREGDRLEDSAGSFEMSTESLSGKVSMINRLATFIEASTLELEEANQKLAEMAVRDGLTGLYNRTEIQRRITGALAEENSQTALIMLDADDFKAVNDNYGHSVGDDVLRLLSKLIHDSCKASGTGAKAGRWGGEEFMILISGKGAERAEEIAEKLRADYERLEIPAAGRQTVSLGTAHAFPGESADSLCMRVDNALYHAKRLGKNRVVIAKAQE
ncbi:MAG: diguanylate cyclase [Ruminococcus sp.]|nr:diguanylate cyclase [Ruminococcus sp.]